MKTPEQMVMEFHEKYGHLISPEPTIDIPIKVIDLRFRLIQEEWDEMQTAMHKGDLVEIADGAADLMYVIVGTCISYGIPIDRVLSEVHSSNMTKTAVKATKGEKYGTKTPKGPDFIAPDIRGILFNPNKQTLLEESNDPT